MNYYQVSYANVEDQKYTECFQFYNEEKLQAFFQRNKLKLYRYKEISKEAFFRDLNKLNQVKNSEVIELVSHLEIIVKSGLPLHFSLEDLALESSKSQIKKILFYVSSSIEQGNTLSSSLKPFHKLFGFSTIYLIRIGEETGALAETLKKAKQFLIQSSALKTKVKLALIYPVTVFIIACIAIVLWFTFVLPQMAEMFASMELQLPWLTQALILISDLVSRSYLYVFIGVALILLTLWQAQKHSWHFRKKLHAKLLTVPLFGPIVKNLNVAYITEFLSLSLSTGTSLFQAIKLVGDNIENIVYQESMKSIAKHLEQGDSFSQALQKEKLYNAFTIRMLNMGENSGDLESQLYTVSRYYTHNVESSTTEMTKIIEPAMIIFVGAVFALIMLGLMGPIFDIVATI